MNSLYRSANTGEKSRKIDLGQPMGQICEGRGGRRREQTWTDRQQACWEEKDRHAGGENAGMEAKATEDARAGK